MQNFRSVKHPAIIQIRGAVDDETYELIKKIVEKTCEEFVFEKIKKGMDIYISDVNEARVAISKIKKIANNIEIKTSTKYAGLRMGRVRTLFVYCLRFG